VYASVTQFTIPHFGDDFEIAQETFERNVVPELRKHAGYEGAYFMRADRGEGMLITLWEDEAAANASESDVPLVEQFDEFLPLLGKIDRAKKRFVVGFADHPVDQV
jgi:hypothetical protein